MKQLIRANPMAAYFVLVFLVAWGIWLPILFLHLPSILIWLGGIAPIGAGILITWIADGKEGFRALLRRLTLDGLSIGWILVAAFLPLGLRLVSMAFDSVLSVATLPLIGLALLEGLVYTPIALFEEVGWRGFVLPRFLQRMPPLASAIVLGVIWAIWHLPLMALNSFLFPDLNLYWWFVDIIFVSVFVTWIFTNTKGNLWLACLFHGMANMTATNLPMQSGSITNSIISLAVGLVIIFVIWKPKWKIQGER